jgi:hypothetical protein
MSSGVAYTLQVVGQKSTPPTIATLLMSLESVFAVLAGCNEEEAVSSGSDLSVPEENSAATSSRELLQGTSSGEEASLPEESQPEESQPEESQPDGNESIDDAELEYLCVYGSFLSGTLEEEVTVQYAEKDGECIFSVPSWEKKYLLPCQTILCGDILGDSAWAILMKAEKNSLCFARLVKISR